MVKKIAVTGDGRKDAVRAAIEEFAEWVNGRAEVVVLDPDGAADLSGAADLIVVFGGDGSMLSVARRLAGSSTPVVGVNMGRFGFLTHFEAGTVRDDLVPVLEAGPDTERWMMLKCAAEDGGAGAGIALNEVFVGSAGDSRILAVEVYIDDEHAATYRGDGVIVATPAGSTAHSLSAGGPIVGPSVDALVLTPVCPHTLTGRPLVIPSGSKVILRPDSPACLKLDGGSGIDMKAGGGVVVEKADHDFVVVRKPSRTYYSSLREKLDWGKPPEYAGD